MTVESAEFSQQTVGSSSPEIDLHVSGTDMSLSDVALREVAHPQESLGTTTTPPHFTNVLELIVESVFGNGSMLGISSSARNVSSRRAPASGPSRADAASAVLRRRRHDTAAAASRRARRLSPSHADGSALGDTAAAA